MNIKPKNICPFYKQECKQLDCAWFTQLRGAHPQTGADIDEWGCAVAWLPILLIETAKEVRQGAAATESFRNVMAEVAQAQTELIGKATALAIEHRKGG